MTALGLAVAVPAVMGYNWLLRRNKTISESLRNFALTCMPTSWAVPACRRVLPSPA
jgi:biopolymer transport protein ExbB